MEAIFKVDKECKHSRRYACEDEKFPLRSVYVNRDMAEKVDTLKVTIESA